MPLIVVQTESDGTNQFALAIKEIDVKLLKHMTQTTIG